MQAFGVIAGIMLLGLISLSGFQLVPESVVGDGVTIDRAAVGTRPNATTRKPNTQVTTTQSVQKEARIDTLGVHDVEQQTATLRGSVTLGETAPDRIFFVYGYESTAVARVLRGGVSYGQLVAGLPASVSVKSVTRIPNRSGEVSVRVGGLAPDTNYQVQMCIEVSGMTTCAAPVPFTTVVGARIPGQVDTPTIRLQSVQFQTADEVTLGGTVNFRDTNDGRVYVLYGESRQLVEQAMQQDYQAIRESDEQLQKARLAVQARGTVSVEKTIGDLEPATNHYYALCASYDGLIDGVVCSRVQSFATHDDDFGETPYVQTLAVTSLGDQAILAGEVSMHPFRNGQVFFVYGTDTNRVARLGGETSLEHIRQSGDRLQRLVVDTDLDQSDTYIARISDLLPDTSYAARLCVEYENQNDRYRDALFVACGEVQTFTTS